MAFDAPYMLMNDAEVEFLLAEALERGIGTGITGTAQSIIMQALKPPCRCRLLSMLHWQLQMQQVATYLATYPYGGPKAKLEMIGDQMWASHFLNWFEAWSDWRRSGYPHWFPLFIREMIQMVRYQPDSGTLQVKYQVILITKQTQPCQTKLMEKSGGVVVLNNRFELSLNQIAKSP